MNSIELLERAQIARSHKKRDEVEIKSTQNQLRYTTWLLSIFQIILIILFATVAGSQLNNDTSPGTVTQGYNMFIGVEIMMLVY